VQLSGATPTFPNAATTTGDAGSRFLGNLGVGFRVLLGERFALRFEIRDLLYTALVNTIDGCTLKQVDSTAGCPGLTSAQAKSNADALLKDNSSDVVNDITFAAGLSYLF